MLTLIAAAWAQLRANLTDLREHPDSGYSTETVVVTAILVALALAAIGDVIYNAVMGKANGISF
ncbi:MAG TPA: hypothetical protein VMB79_13605 [Jatrophihabitans sp.]|nr:hypothetical protein [Jatrophihabitans sp.]